MWEPANLIHSMDGHTWGYTNEKRHFMPPDHTVPTDAKLIVDLGCNAGFSTGILADNWREAKVLGVELNPDTAQRAFENLIDFRGRVHIVNAAVGYPEREAIAVFTSANAVDHLKDYPWDNGREQMVQVKTLDRILKECGVEDMQIDFLKIDIEGAEWEVLHDGGKWSERTRVLVLEGHSNYYEGWQFVDAVIARGFDTYQREDGQIVGTRL